MIFDTAWGNYYRGGGAAISEFRGCLPPVAAKTVRTISRIDHQLLPHQFWTLEFSKTDARFEIFT